MRLRVHKGRLNSVAENPMLQELCRQPSPTAPQLPTSFHPCIHASLAMTRRESETFCFNRPRPTIWCRFSAFPTWRALRRRWVRPGRRLRHIRPFRLLISLLPFLKYRIRTIMFLLYSLSTPPPPFSTSHLPHQHARRHFTRPPFVFPRSRCTSLTPSTWVVHGSGLCKGRDKL